LRRARRQDAAKQDDDDHKKSQCAAHILTNTAQQAPFQAGQHSLLQENSRKRDGLSRSRYGNIHDAVKRAG
jgi:hypothetical protein